MINRFVWNFIAYIIEIFRKLHFKNKVGYRNSQLWCYEMPCLPVPQTTNSRLKNLLTSWAFKPLRGYLPGHKRSALSTSLLLNLNTFLLIFQNHVFDSQEPAILNIQNGEFCFLASYSIFAEIDTLLIINQFYLKSSLKCRIKFISSISIIKWFFIIVY